MNSLYPLPLVKLFFFRFSYHKNIDKKKETASNCRNLLKYPCLVLSRQLLLCLKQKGEKYFSILFHNLNYADGWRESITASILVLTRNRTIHFNEHIWKSVFILPCVQPPPPPHVLLCISINLCPAVEWHYTGVTKIGIVFKGATKCCRSMNFFGNYNLMMIIMCYVCRFP